jgi:hypothetical protein
MHGGTLADLQRGIKLLVRRAARSQGRAVAPILKETAVSSTSKQNSTHGEIGSTGAQAKTLQPAPGNLLREILVAMYGH